MQELPELDIYRAMLAERFAGAQITAFHIHSNKTSLISDDQLVKEVVDKTVWFVERRAQHLIFHLDNGKRLVIHLSDQAYLYSYLLEEEIDTAKASISLHFGDRMLSFFGLRPGSLLLLTVKGVEEHLKGFGPDPLDKRISLNRFMDKFAKKRSALKTALMDQSILSGIGTVYADEIAFAAGIGPEVKLSELDPQGWEQLYLATGNILREAISHGGAGTKPLFASDIFTGGYIERFKVFEREGMSCVRCEGTIEKRTAGNRKAYACSNCQSKAAGKE